MMDKEQRLDAFEKMLDNVKNRYKDTSEKLDKLKNEGKTKSVTYKQLFAEKLSLQKMLAMYELYGIE